MRKEAPTARAPMRLTTEGVTLWHAVYWRETVLVAWRPARLKDEQGADQRQRLNLAKHALGTTNRLRRKGH